MFQTKQDLIDLEYRLLVVDDTESIHDDFRNIFASHENHKHVAELQNSLFGETSTTSANEKTNLLNNISIDSAYSGEQGIDRMSTAIEQSNFYAVAVIDVRMPGGMDGVKTASQILEMDPEIQLIICSAYSDYRWEEMTELLHLSDRWVILKKPFDVIEARQLVVSLCQKWALLKDMKGHIIKQTQVLQKQIKKLKSAQSEIHQLAYYDSLTQLPNRNFFKELLKQSIKDSKRNKTYIGLLFLDLDNFKRINDTYGHETGDALLKQIARRINTFVRSYDVIGRRAEPSWFEEDQADNPHDTFMTPSRLGGDEFTIILRNFSCADDIMATAKRLLTNITEETLTVKGHRIKTNVSIGVSIYPIDSEDPDYLLKNADIALHHAKNNGKNQVSLHNKALNEAVMHRNRIEQSIGVGLKQEEFYLVYQPKVAIASRKIIGCEALIRWKHPEMGLLPPCDFIPIAEETHLIVDIDNYVLDHACQQIAQWRHIPAFKNLTTSINLSARFFHEKEVVASIKKAIERHNISPRSLEIELTETYFINAKKQVAKCLLELRQLYGEGLSISIDDFGVGYSSLNYLNEFEIDSLKIDRSFIQKMISDKKTQSIVAYVIDLSHKLNKNVIAEGVETDEQLAFLKKLKCDEAQGFLLAKPMSADELLKFIQSWDG